MGAKTLLETSGAPTATTAGATQYWFLSTASITVPQTVEANRQVIYQSPGVLSKLYVRVTASTTSATSTVVVRNNAADAALTLTIGAGATGVFEDTAHTVTVAAGDKLCYKTISGGTGTMTIGVFSTVFLATTGAVTRLTAGPTTAAYNLDSVSRFGQLVGTLTPNTATESVVKTKTTKPVTYKNLGIFVSANARTSATTVKSRKNGADGNITLSIGATTTGWIEDTTHSDTVAVGDDYNWTFITGAGSGESMTVQSVSCDAVDTAEGAGVLMTGTTAGLVQNASVTNYIPTGGNLAGASTTEASVKMKTREAFTLSGMSIFTSANTVTATSTLRIRINGAPGNQVVSIPASTASVISDTTHSDVVAATDDIDYELVTGATGTSMTVRNISMNHALLSRVTQTYTHRYNILARVSQTFTHRYNILARISQTYTHRYNILARISQTYTHRYNILQRVSQTFTQRYNILQRITQNFTHIYKILEEAVVLPAAAGAAGGSQGRSPLYRLVKPKTVAVIIRLKVQLEYEVTKLTITIAIPYIIEKQSMIKYASAIIVPRLNILPLRTKPTPKPAKRTIITQLPYQVERIQLKSACAYEVDKLITRKQHLETLRIAVNYLISDFTSYTKR